MPVVGVGGADGIWEELMGELRNNYDKNTLHKILQREFSNEKYI